MKAAVMYGPNDIRVEQVPKPVCDKDGMILKVDAIGLCGSDIRNLSTDSRKGKYPCILGHEQVGTIVEIGPEVPKVNKFKVGDRIYVHPLGPCQRCESCLIGKQNMCKNVKTYADVQGGFAEYMPIPAWGIEGGHMWAVPDGIKSEHASLGEPLSSVYACQEDIDVKIGDTLVIIGAGPIGCFHSELAKMRGASQVIMVEINEHRLNQSLKFGVDHAVNAEKVDPVDAVMKITGGRGAEKVISANPSTKAQQQSIYMCAPGGIVTFFGGVPKGEMAEIDSNHVHYSNMWIFGQYGATTMQCKKAYDLVLEGRFDASKYVTHIMPLDEINEAIELTKTGEALKVVLEP